MKFFINLLVIFVILLHSIEVNAGPGKKTKSLSQDIYPKTHVLDGPLEPPGFEWNHPGRSGSPRPILHHGGSSGQSHSDHQPGSPSAFRPYSGNQQPNIRPFIPPQDSTVPEPANHAFRPYSGNQQHEGIFRPIARKPDPPGS